MAVRFLSQEWADAVTHALNSSQEFGQAAARHEATVQQVVTGTPDGESRYFFTLEEGRAQVGLGEIEGADATVTQSYDTAMAISKRELHPQQAFMQGKLSIRGNLMKMLHLGPVLSALAHAISALDVEYPSQG